MKIQLGLIALLASLTVAPAEGISWPDNQLLPTFSKPASNLDCIDLSSASSAEADLFASLQGIVNRTQPLIACVSGGDGEGKFTWLDLHNLSYTVTNGYGVILKYRSDITGLVVTDPSQPDTLNLATTIAGVNDQLICDPSLLATLTNAPYNLPIGVDLRGRFSSKQDVYNYLYANYWPQCTHRILTGLFTDLHGELRDYCVAVKSAVVWLDPGNSQDQSTLTPFVTSMAANKSIYMGWWPSEGSGLNWIAGYGIPVVASDYFRNGTVFSGVQHPINVPDIPPPPPLQNKVYVSLILSDGDNIQYMQHVMKMRWDTSARGSIPIGWTATPLSAEMDPMMLNYYWSTATTNDCLISGPSGAGYTHMQNWNSANLSGFAKISDAYLQHSGLRVITIWEHVTTGVARAFATNCPTLLGLTDQSGYNYTTVNLGLRTIGLAVAYSSSTSAIISGIENAAQSWNGTAPMFIAAQAVTWDLQPADLVTVANALDPNKYVIVRPDHLFMLANQIYGKPQATTEPAIKITPNNATLRGAVLPNAANAGAWIEWGTNVSYGFKSAVTNVSGSSIVFMSASATGLQPKIIYHYRVGVSNAMGTVWGADKIFTTGGRVKAWGDGAQGQTNVPSGLTNVTEISAGAYHGLALKNDGSVTAWGMDNDGQTNVPSGLNGAVEVAGGIQHSLALKSDGTVTAWGDNTYGQTNVPTGLNNVVDIAASGYHNLALKSDGTVAAWGYDNYGQTNVPTGLSNVVAVAAGRYHSLALKSDGTVTAWGNNVYGQANVPAGLDQVVAISAGDYHSLALKADGISAPDLHPVSRWVADDLTGANGTPVGLWSDEMQDLSAVQITSAKQPILHTDALNGHKVIHFSSANSQFLTVPASGSPMSGASDFTLAMVFKTSTPGITGSSFYQNTGLLGCEQPNAVADWALCLNGSQLGLGLGAGSSSCSSDVSLYGGNVVDDAAHIAMYVRSGNVVRLYVDGVIVAEQNALCTAARGNYDFQIGAMSTGSGFFDGDIAEVQIYNHALSFQEITTVDGILADTYGMSGVAGAPSCRWIADDLSGADGSAIGNWTDAIGGKTATQTSTGNQPRLYANGINGHKVLRFSSGSSQYLTVSAADSPISAAGSFTLVAVFKTSTPGSSSSLFYQNTGLLGCEQPNQVKDWAFCLNGTQLGFGLGAGANNCGTDFSLYGGNVTDGKPHIAMCVRAGETISLYVDGVRVATQSGLCTAARNNYPFRIGAMTSGSYFFNGDIAEIQIYNRALDAREIVSKNETLATTYGIGGSAGAVAVWGTSAYNLVNPPSNLSSVSSVASGSDFNVALGENGLLTGWGNNSQGQINFPVGLTNVAAIAGGTGFSLAIGDQPPVANDQTVSGFVNHDLTITLDAANPDGNSLNYHIESLPGAGSLYQYADGSRGATIGVPDALVSDSQGRVIFAPATDETGNPYTTFSYMVDDGVYPSSTATVTANISLPAIPQFTDVSWTGGNTNGLNLSFSGNSNATYSVWAATNLVDWIRIGTAMESQPGMYEYLDEDVSNRPQRFYRISAP